MSKKVWGRLAENDVHRYELGNEGGVRVVVSDLGATMLSCTVPDGDGAVDLILGCDTIDQYLKSGTYFGATVGRYGNRIKRGRFTLGGRGHRLDCNEGENHLHGGAVGFDKRLWTVGQADSESITMSLISDDGDEGYPGTVVARVQYSVLGSVLRYELLATADAPTPINLLNHSYWNLAGQGDVLDHLYQFDADFYTPCDDELMLTGEIASVEATPFDFRTPHTVRERIERINNAGAGRVTGTSGGYDHNLVLNGFNGDVRRVGRIEHSESGRALTVATTEPGLHFYTGGYLGGVAKRGGDVYPAFAGFTLETQKFPDSPNIGHFPSTVLHPGQVYRHVTELTFEF